MQTQTLPQNRLEVEFVVEGQNRSILVTRRNGEGDFIVVFRSGYEAFTFKKHFNRLMYRIVHLESWGAREAGTCLVSIPWRMPMFRLEEVIKQFLVGETYFSLNGYVVREDYDECDEDWIY